MCPLTNRCSRPTWPCTSFFGMTTSWWPYSAWLLGTCGRYPASACHPPWYFPIGPTDLYPAAAVAPLPSHFIGTYTFINGSLHASLSFMWPSLVPGSRTLFVSMYHACSASGVSILLKCLQLSYSTPKDICSRQSAPTFYSCSLMFSNPACTSSTIRLCGAFIRKNFFRYKE